MLLALYLITQVIELRAVIERDLKLKARPVAERISPLSVSSYLPTPVLSLLNLELQQGLLLTEQHQLALQIQAHAVAALRGQFTATMGLNRDQALKFLTRLGRYVDQHYIYQTHLPLGQGLINGALDCDMRVFLYLSVAESLGYHDFYFVMAPGHALVGWQAGDSQPLLWETTSTLGNIAKLSNSHLYKPVANKRYGDYQLASARSSLVQSQLTAAAAWSLSRGAKDDDLDRALALFDDSLEQFYTANIAAAKVLLGSRDLVADIPRSQAYADYAKTYPYALGAQLYQLSLLLFEQQISNEEKQQALVHAEVLLEQGVVNPVVEAILRRFGNSWQQFNGIQLQSFAQRLGRVLYPSQPFIRARDRVAEGRVVMIGSVYFALFAALISVLILGLKKWRHSNSTELR